MPLLDLQARSYQAGEIRTGEKYTTSTGQVVPRRRDTFRFTTGSLAIAEAVAAQFGGEPRPWGDGEWEVATDTATIGVTVPPRDQVFSQWYEMWTAAGCARRCDGRTEQVSGQPCLCAPLLARFPAGAERGAERKRLAGLRPPQACTVKTRLSVLIPDLPGLGVFLLTTGSVFAAMEMGDAANLLETARDHGVYLPAQLRIEQREIKRPGQQTRKFGVPVLEVLASIRQITSGELPSGSVTAGLPPAPGGTPKELPPGRPASGTETGGTAAAPPPAKPPKAEGAPTAQRIADLLHQAHTPADVDKLAALAAEHRLLDHLANTAAPGDDEAFEELGAAISARRAELAAAHPAGRPPARPAVRQPPRYREPPDAGVVSGRRPAPARTSPPPSGGDGSLFSPGDPAYR